MVSTYPGWEQCLPRMSVLRCNLSSSKCHYSHYHQSSTISHHCIMQLSSSIYSEPHIPTKPTRETTVMFSQRAWLFYFHHSYFGGYNSKYSEDYTSTDCDNVLMLTGSGALTAIVFLCSLTLGHACFVLFCFLLLFCLFVFSTHICDKFIRPLNLLSGWAVYCDQCEHILSEALACMCQWDLCSFIWILQIVSNLQWNGCSLFVGTYRETIQPYGLQRAMDYGPFWCLSSCSICAIRRHHTTFP